jgi:uncharacterized membrane protein YoaK (UPF0700 family)
VNRDPFLRIALLAAATVYAVGVALVERWLGPVAMVGVVLLGVALAVLASVDFVPTPTAPPAAERRRERQPEDGTRGFQRIP